MRTATVIEIQENFDHFLELSEKEPIGIIGDSGEVTCVLVGVELYEKLGGKIEPGKDTTG